MARWEQQCFPNSIILTCIIGKVLFFISGTWVWWQMIDKIVGGVGGCSPPRHTTRMQLSWANFLSFNSCRDSDYRPFIRWPEKLIASEWNLCISDSRLSCNIISCFLFIFREAEILERRNQGRKGRSSQKYLFILLNSAHKGGTGVLLGRELVMEMALPFYDSPFILLKPSHGRKGSTWNFRNRKIDAELQMMTSTRRYWLIDSSWPAEWRNSSRRSLNGKKKH